MLGASVHAIDNKQDFTGSNKALPLHRWRTRGYGFKLYRTLHLRRLYQSVCKLWLLPQIAANHVYITLLMLISPSSKLFVKFWMEKKHNKVRHLVNLQHAHSGGEKWRFRAPWLFCSDTELFTSGRSLVSNFSD